MTDLSLSMRCSVRTYARNVAAVIEWTDHTCHQNPPGGPPNLIPSHSVGPPRSVYRYEDINHASTISWLLIVSIQDVPAPYFEDAVPNQKVDYVQLLYLLGTWTSLAAPGESLRESWITRPLEGIRPYAPSQLALLNPLPALIGSHTGSTLLAETLKDGIEELYEVEGICINEVAASKGLTDGKAQSNDGVVERKINNHRWAQIVGLIANKH